MLQTGEVAPAFDLIDQDGVRRRLADERGSWVVVYFYPKDDTPGCTVEACEFRDTKAMFAAAGAVVYGVSADGQAAHRDFAGKFQLNFPLLVDEDLSTIKAYGAYGEKEVAGNKVMGILRVSYLIDPDGRVARVWEKVDPLGHAEDVLANIRALKAAV